MFDYRRRVERGLNQRRQTAVAAIFHARRSGVEHVVPGGEAVEHDFFFVELLGKRIGRIARLRGVRAARRGLVRCWTIRRPRPTPYGSTSSVGSSTNSTAAQSAYLRAAEFDHL